MKPGQLLLDFQPGLTVQFKSLTEVCAAAVYASRGGLSAVAADLDIAPSDLSRRLHSDAGENRPLTVEQFDGILSSTRDMRPIHWLAEKYLQDPEAKKTQAIEQVGLILPLLIALLEQSGVSVNTKLRNVA